MSISEQIRRAAAGVAAGADFNPETDITWHSLFWAEGTDFVAQGYSDTDPVGTWPNETGESDAVQAGADSLKPTYRASTAALNGQPTVQGDGGDGLNTGTFTSNPDYTAGISIVAIAQITSITVSYMWSGRNSSNRNDLYTLTSPTSWNAFGPPAALQVGGDDAPDTNAHFLTVFYPGSTFSGDMELWVDGTSVGSDTNSTAEIDGLALFCRYTAGATSIQAHLAMLGIYEGDFTSDGSYADFTTWAEDHYGLTIA